MEKLFFKENKYLDLDEEEDENDDDFLKDFFEEAV